MLIVIIFLSTLIHSQNYEAHARMYLKSIQDNWIATGVMCEADRSTYFYSLAYIEYDTKVMVERLNLMNSTTPPFSDIQFLPSLKYAEYAHLIEEEYLQYLYIRWRWAADEQERLYVTEVIRDTRKRRDFYYYVGVIHENRWNTGRRVNLESLRDLVGVENYNNKHWPSPLPYVAYYYDWPNITPIVQDYER